MVVLQSRSHLQQTLSSSLQRHHGSRHGHWILNLGSVSLGDDEANLVIWCVFSLMRLTVGVVLIFCVFWQGFLLVFWGFVGIFRRFHWEFTKGFICLVWLGFLLVFWVSIGFKRYFFVAFSGNPQWDLLIFFYGFRKGWVFSSCYCADFSSILGLFVKGIHGDFSRSDQGSVR